MSEHLESINKHAYLIMAHNEESLLYALLEDIDDERNDIFLHIDIKAHSITDSRIKEAVRNAKLVLLPRTDVRWGSFSQIQCVYSLLKSAVDEGYHAYYHFLVGTEFPVKSQDYIHAFFDEHQGAEFIGFDSSGSENAWRISLFHPFARCARPKNVLEAIANNIRRAIVKAEKLVGVDRLSDCNLIIKKGNANWSITDDLAKYLVDTMPRFTKVFNCSYCADELIVHTLTYNSRFVSRVYDLDDEYESNMRVVQWGNSNNLYHAEDLPFLLSTDKLFARKFSGEEGLRLVKEICLNRL